MRIVIIDREDYAALGKVNVDANDFMNKGRKAVEEAIAYDPILLRKVERTSHQRDGWTYEIDDSELRPAAAQARKRGGKKRRRKQAA